MVHAYVVLMHTKVQDSNPMQDCCEPYHSGAAQPANIEAALRARFCAFVRGKEDYIVGTFHPQYHCFKYGAELPGRAGQGQGHAPCTIHCFLSTTYNSNCILHHA